MEEEKQKILYKNKNDIRVLFGNTAHNLAYIKELEKRIEALENGSSK